MAEPRRRILMTADTVGGVFAYALTLARALAPDEVVLATMGAPLSGTQAAEARAIGNLRVVESAFRLEWMQDPWDDVARAGEWLLELARTLRPDVVHLNQLAHGALPWPAPVVMVGHSDVQSWFRAVRGQAAPPEWDRYRAEVGRGLGAADLVVAPSRAMLASLAADYGPFARACVVENGRDPELFHPRVKRPFVFAAGRLWDDAKNLRALEAAAPRVAWPIVVAGACAHPDGGTRVPRGLTCLGPRSTAEMSVLYGEAAIYALPARYEPFGLSVLEAALAGCALVLGDIPSMRELWDGAARFVPPDDPAALAIALGHLIADPAARAAQAAAAVTRAHARTPARMAAAYRARYDALLAGGAEEGAACG